MRIEVIASGSTGNAYSLHSEGTAPLLLEAGIPYKRLQVALNHRVSSLAGCLISHEHGDHAQSAKRLTEASVDVFGSAGTLAALNLPWHRAFALESFQPRLVGEWQVLPFPAIHDAMEPLGFMVAAPDGDKLLYLTDSAYTPYTFRGLTHVLVEANYSQEIMHRNLAAGNLADIVAARTVRNHMSLEGCLALLKANDLSSCRSIGLIHLSNGNSDAAAFKQAVEAATGIPTFIAPERGVLA